MKEEGEGIVFKLIRDSSRRSRGGEAHLLDVSCSKCDALLIKYQKDGKGDLLRCYLNRVFSPPQYGSLHSNPAIQQPRDMPNLECSKCKTIIGTPMRYDDGRLAFRMRKGTFRKKRVL